jgi:hypothetical protein
MVEVFKTNVHKVNQAKKLTRRLLEYFPGYIINFDLEDCDKILRIKAETIDTKEINSILNNFGFNCEELPD